MFAMGDIGVPPRRERGGTWTALGLALGVVTLLNAPRNGQGDFRRDELECEEAVAHLERCCGELPPERVSCEFDEWDCDSSEEDCGCSGSNYVFPDLHGDTADCLRQRSCDELRAAGTCAVALDPNGGAIRCQ